MKLVNLDIFLSINILTHFFLGELIASPNVVRIAKCKQVILIESPAFTNSVEKYSSGNYNNAYTTPLYLFSQAKCKSVLPPFVLI